MTPIITPEELRSDAENISPTHDDGKSYNNYPADKLRRAAEEIERLQNFILMIKGYVNRIDKI